MKPNDVESQVKQERPALADKPARRLRNVCTVYVRAVIVREYVFYVFFKIQKNVTFTFF